MRGYQKNQIAIGSYGQHVHRQIVTGNRVPFFVSAICESCISFSVLVAPHFVISYRPEE